MRLKLQAGLGHDSFNLNSGLFIIKEKILLLSNTATDLITA